MKVKIALIALLLCVCQFASAQSQDSTAFYRHTVGITINPIYDNAFNTIHPVAYGLLYRYQYSTAKAIRIGVSGAYERQSYLTTHREHPAPQDSLINIKLFDLSLGHEWQSKISELITLGFGTDISLHLLRQHEEVDNILIGDNTLIRQEYRQEFNTSGIGLKPFINVQLKLSPRLFLVAECQASLAYSKTEYTASGTHGNIDVRPEDRGVLFGGDKREKFSTDLKPLSSLQLNFRL